MSKIGQEIIEGLKQAVDYVEDRADKTKYGHYEFVKLPDSIDVQAIRKELNLSQASFASLFGLSLSSLKNWEQGRRQPDKAVRAYLTVIQRNPDAVRAALSM